MCLVFFLRDKNDSILNDDLFTDIVLTLTFFLLGNKRQLSSINQIDKYYYSKLLVSY